ncbi:MAG: hypothetical protein C0605_04695 [Hyphomicrobiales bacterium]|nr:MAG: hypothetical protein C0605_04695 [Hyphomicrobiales bacterium]
MLRLGSFVLFFLFPALVLAGEWQADGMTPAASGRPGFYSAGISIKDIRFSLRCEPASRRISLAVKADHPLAAAELGDRVAKAAAGGGAYDLLINTTAYPRTARFDPAGAVLLFNEPVGKDGQLLEDLMSEKELVISNRPLRLSFPLAGSREVICASLTKCGIVQSGCVAKGLQGEGAGQGS